MVTITTGVWDAQHALSVAKKTQTTQKKNVTENTTVPIIAKITLLTPTCATFGGEKKIF